MYRRRHNKQVSAYTWHSGHIQHQTSQQAMFTVYSLARHIKKEMASRYFEKKKKKVPAIKINKQIKTHWQKEVATGPYSEAINCFSFSLFYGSSPTEIRKCYCESISWINKAQSSQPLRLPGYHLIFSPHHLSTSRVLAWWKKSNSSPSQPRKVILAVKIFLFPSHAEKDLNPSCKQKMSLFPWEASDNLEGQVTDPEHPGMLSGCC